LNERVDISVSILQANGFFELPALMTKLAVLFGTERLLPIMAAPTLVFPMHIDFLIQTRRLQARLQDCKALSVAETAIRPFHVDV